MSAWIGWGLDDIITHLNGLDFRAHVSDKAKDIELCRYLKLTFDFEVVHGLLGSKEVCVCDIKSVTTHFWACPLWGHKIYWWIRRNGFGNPAVELAPAVRLLQYEGRRRFWVEGGRGEGWFGGWHLRSGVGLSRSRIARGKIVYTVIISNNKCSLSEYREDCCTARSSFYLRRRSENNTRFVR